MLKNLQLLLFAIFCVGLFQVKAQVSEGDSLALVSLYNATNGPNWVKSDGWLSEPVSAWFGVITEADRVIEVNLPGNVLDGNIPPEIGDLTELTSLLLYGNNLTGPIPPEIGNLSNLSLLSLHTNQLNGSIPSEIGLLTNLTTLSLRNNRLTGTVPELNALSSLGTLRLDGNELTGHSGFSGLTVITSLNLSNNYFDFEDLESIGGIQGLVLSPQKPFGSSYSLVLKPGDPLNLSFTVAGSANTYQWYKEGNALDGANSNVFSISETTQADHGRYFLRVFNDITGTSMDSETIFVSLIKADEGDSLALVTLFNETNGVEWFNNENWLTGPLMSWHGVTVVQGRVRELHLVSNNLSGNLPPEISVLSQLEVLDLAQNQLTGTIDPELSALTNLHTLYLWNNQFIGQVPAEIGNMIPLQILALDGNQLSGELPSELGLLTNLTFLDLRGNAFTGSIPASFGSLVNLEALFLNDNRLSGDVPTEFTNLTLLQRLTLENNYLSNLPDLSMLTSLSDFPIYNNYFTFEDIEPNVVIPGIDYYPQNPFGEAATLRPFPGEQLTLAFSVGGSYNTYQWIKDGNPVQEATTPSHVINAVAASDEGVYWLDVYNSLTGMTLSSQPIEIDVKQTFYWVGNGGSWDDSFHWSETSGGPSAGVVPTSSDDVIFDGNSFSLPNQVVTIPDFGTSVGFNFKTMDWRAVTNHPTFRIRAEQSEWIYNECYGSIYFSDNMSLDFKAAEFYMFNTEGDYDFDTRNLFLGLDSWIWFGSMHTGNIVSDVNGGQLYIDRGTLNFNGHTFIGQNADYPALWLNGSVNSLTVDISNSFIDVGALHIDGQSNLIDDAAMIKIRRNLRAQNQDLNYVVIDGNVSMHGLSLNNTFQTLEILPHSVFNLKSGTVQTVSDLLMNGDGSAQPALRTVTAGAPATILKSSGVVYVHYARIKDITATGGATFNALQSFDEGNNIGWNFAQANVPMADSLALLAIYNAMNGDAWTNKTGWFELPVYQWYGVTVTDGRVTRLTLTGNNLTGSIPADIGSLEELSILDLGGNQLTETIPPEIYNLQHLETLGLAFNNLEGEISASIGNLQNLRNIYLNDNEFSGVFPDVFSALPELRTFWIQENKFEGDFPSSFGALTNLALFGINNNEFTSFPAVSTSLLSSGNVSNNRLTFNSLVPNKDLPILLMPQKELVKENIHVALGSSATITIEGNDNADYLWYKNYNFASGSPTITISNAVPSDGGIYQVYIHHPDVPGQLSVRAFDVVVESPGASSETGYKFVKKLGAEANGTFYYNPSKITIDGDGNFYIVDQDTRKIAKLDAVGNLLSTIDLPTEIAVSDLDADAEGNLFISDESHQRIVKYNADGTFGYEAPGQATYGIAVDTEGSVIMISRNDFRVHRYSGVNGELIETVELSGIEFSEVYTDVEVDANGDIIAILPSQSRVDRFSYAGEFIGSLDLASFGVAAWASIDISVTDDGSIYFHTGNRVYGVNNDGMLMVTIGDVEMLNIWGCEVTINGVFVTSPVRGLLKYDHTGTLLEELGPQRNAPGEFNEISHITQDKKGFRYISDYYNGRVQKFSSDGELVSIIGSQGSANDQMKYATSVAVDDDGNVYVSDRENDRIQKYDAAGNFLQSIGTSGSGDGQFLRPAALAISVDGFLYVGDGDNVRIQKLTLNGDHVLSFGTQGSGPGQINRLGPIALEKGGTIAVVSIGEWGGALAKVMRFNTSTGAFIEEIEFLYSFVDNMSSDANGDLYMTAFDRAYKLDKNLGFKTFIGQLGLDDGQMMGPHAISANPSGDTVWVGSYRDRLLIFAANEGSISSADSLALVDLYNSTDGNNWTNKTNWLSGPLNTWYGLTVTSGRIRGIDLSENNLTGILPITIGELTDLVSLDLGENNLTGEAPEILSAITSLQELNLANNKLSGNINIPEQVSVLYLHENELTSINIASDWLSQADLSGNNFESLPTFAGNHVLEWLNVAHNKLTFEDLEPLADFDGLLYAPQDSVGIETIIVKELGEAITLESSVGGTGNLYVWKKDSAVITGATAAALTLSNLQLGDDALYNFEVSNPNFPDLTIKSFVTDLRISSLERDLQALTALYNSTNGAQWTNKTGWLSADLSTWNGVTINNNRVTAVNLANNNLKGRIPVDLLVMRSLVTLNVANNDITRIPDFTPLTALSTLNVSGNRLDFESLIPNANKTGINYANQKLIGAPIDTKVEVGSDYKLKVITAGAGNKYSWKRNGTIVNGATDSTYVIQAINRTNMGSYVAEVRNDLVANLVLSTPVHRVLATASLSGTLTVNGTNALGGKVTLFRVQSVGKYDTIAMVNVTNGAFAFTNQVLDDYELLGFADTLKHPNVLPTYYTNKIYWEDADIIHLEQSLSGLVIESGIKLSEPLIGEGKIYGTLEEEIEDEAGRVKAKTRVQGAGVSVRRTERSARDKEAQEVIAYVFTNDKGEFQIKGLEEGFYLLNIQYPGFPMNPDSDIELEVGTGLRAAVPVVAEIKDNAITVTREIITSLGGEPYSVGAYPNPAKDVIHLSFSNHNPNRSVQLSDLRGQSLRLAGATSKLVTIDVSDFHSGVYIIQVIEKGVRMKSIKVTIE